MPTFTNPKLNTLWQILNNPKFTPQQKISFCEKEIALLTAPLSEYKNKSFLLVFMEEIVKDVDEKIISEKLELLFALKFDFQSHSYLFELFFDSPKNLKPAQILLKKLKQKNISLVNHFLFMAVYYARSDLLDEILKDMPHREEKIHYLFEDKFVSEQHIGIRNPNNAFSLLFYAIFYVSYSDKYQAQTLIKALCKYGSGFEDFLFANSISQSPSQQQAKCTLLSATSKEIEHYNKRETYMIYACKEILSHIMQEKNLTKKEKQIADFYSLLKIIVYFKVEKNQQLWPKLFELVMEHSVQLITVNNGLNTQLIFFSCFCYNSYPKGLQNLLKEKPDWVNFIGDLKGQTATALFLAIELNNILLVRYLINRGANLNYQLLEKKITALDIAAEKGCKEILIELLNAGANPHLYMHDMPHFLAALKEKHYVCASILMRAIFDSNNTVLVSLQSSLLLVIGFDLLPLAPLLKISEKLELTEQSNSQIIKDSLEASIANLQVENTEVEAFNLISTYCKKMDNTHIYGTFFIEKTELWVLIECSKSSLENANFFLYDFLQKAQLLTLPEKHQLPEEGIKFVTPFKEFLQKAGLKVVRKTIKSDAEDPFVDTDKFIQDFLIKQGGIKESNNNNISNTSITDLYKKTSSGKKKLKPKVIEAEGLLFLPPPKTSKEEKTDYEQEKWLSIITREHVQMITNHHNTEVDFVSFIHPSLYEDKRMTAEIWKQLYHAATHFARTSGQTGLEAYKGHQQVLIQINDQPVVAREVTYAVKNSGTDMRFYCCLFWSNLGTPMLFAFDVDEHEKQFSGQTFKLTVTEKTLKQLKEIEPKDALIASSLTN